VAAGPDDPDVFDSGLRDGAFNGDASDDGGSPGTIEAALQIEQGPLVHSRQIHLLLSGPQATEMRLAEGPATIDSAQWIPFVARSDWTLAPGDGPKTIHAQLRSAAGALSPVVSASTELRLQVRLVTTVGPEERVGEGGARPSVAVDSQGHPHIAVNNGALTRIFLHHRLGGAWRGAALGSATDFSQQGQLMESPRLEIDPQDRAWISGHLFRSDVVEACGHALYLVDRISTEPTVRWARRHYRHWGHGSLSLDPAHPEQAVLMTFRGMWLRVDASGAAMDQGELYPGTSGEKIDFRIAPQAGQTGVWHAMQSGYSQSPSSYQNSLRDQAGQPIVVWADYGCYPEQGEDTRRPAIGIDTHDPRRLVAGLRGLACPRQVRRNRLGYTAMRDRLELLQPRRNRRHHRC